MKRFRKSSRLALENQGAGHPGFRQWSGGFHGGCLVRPLGVVEPDPVAESSIGMLLALEAMPLHALLFDRTDDAAQSALSRVITA
jgi:hypothetical protein